MLGTRERGAHQGHPRAARSAASCGSAPPASAGPVREQGGARHRGMLLTQARPLTSGAAPRKSRARTHLPPPPPQTRGPRATPACLCTKRRQTWLPKRHTHTRAAQVSKPVEPPEVGGWQARRFVQRRRVSCGCKGPLAARSTRPPAQRAAQAARGEHGSNGNTRREAQMSMFN